MNYDATNDIKQIILQFNNSIKAQMPVLEDVVSDLITTKNTDGNAIENCLDTLLSITVHGFGKEQFIRLLEYYKTIDAEGALFYWNEYDKKE